jgi:hypothetical protein
MASHDGQVIENLRIITTTKAPGIYVMGKKNVTIRNCTISHSAQKVWPFGNGIYFTGADGLVITDVEVELVGVASGPLPDLHNYNINGISSSGVRISNVRTEGGSTGIELNKCDGAHVSNFVAFNMHGPYPRGQCFQCGYSDNVIVEDFYCKSDNTSWTEDNLSLYRSSNVTVRRGLIDGNNSPTGVGVMFEQDDPTKHGGLCEDVDAVHMGDGREPTSLAASRLSRHTSHFAEFRMLFRVRGHGNPLRQHALQGQPLRWLGDAEETDQWEPDVVRGR